MMEVDVDVRLKSELEQAEGANGHDCNGNGSNANETNEVSNVQENSEISEYNESHGESSLTVTGSDSEDEDEENITPATGEKKTRDKEEVDYYDRNKPRKASSSYMSYKNRCNKFSKILVSELKKSGEPFVQDFACPNPNNPAIPNSRLSQCTECRSQKETRDRGRKDRCRFYAFRKLKYIRAGLMAFNGFCDPFTDPDEKDLSIWMPSPETKPTDLGTQTAQFLLYQLGDQFCELIQQEMDAFKLYEEIKAKKNVAEDSDDDIEDKPAGGATLMTEKMVVNKIAWKRPVKDIREMCDACETTLFNCHWTCPRCGFVVCVSCFKAKYNGSQIHKLSEKCEKRSGRDEYNWFWCLNRRPHELDKLMMSQVIPKDVLTRVCAMVHDVREDLGIPQFCCDEGRRRIAQNNQLMTNLKGGSWNIGITSNSNIPSALATPIQPPCSQTTLKKPRPPESSDDEDDENDDEAEDSLALSNLFKKRRMDQQAGASVPTVDTDTAKPVVENPTSVQMISMLEPVNNTNPPVMDWAMEKFNPKQWRLLPILITSLEETSVKFQGVPHSWLCNGRLLRLHDPACEGNFGLFQEVWKRGQPVIVSNVAQRLNKELWSPESFCLDFGELKHDLVNCSTGKLVCAQQMKVFWNGFGCISKRLRDAKGEPMLLKLKDWPPGADFKEILPSRFRDLMSALPLKEYTQRDGRLNLAARLPAQFVRPDLGPKMYIAYGSGTHFEKGTTNLHLDISDAVNLMVHVGVPDEDLENHNKGVNEAIFESDCDYFTIQRIREGNEIPGALWHIYNSRDADKIRDLINKVSVERGIPPKRNHDPIHDQCAYLDKKLRLRLKTDYNVVGYPIIQCVGDAVFIPAGAPHQVRNLQNCIKIAEDFVSPENVSHCFRLTEEFRNLSDTHTNHEDKLQIKNIIYHAVKDAVSVVQIQTPSANPTTPHPKPTEANANGNGGVLDTSASAVAHENDNTEC